ncbi:shTK domain protein [Ancylostoma ceylanicum]|uniref:ShTK domain protein n=2 Tax=Ancylostoma ceylanicum TaxID=53326 RepID=A0A0D6LR83_9BILA|nr:shTK domain protein [Ancylostoma ceylanicum]EYB93378.1 hypothetical protein Y032_0183g950 [Ancylostoma ceylanicum]
MVAFLALLVFVLHTAQAQLKVCNDAGALPCVVGKCPLASQTCINTAKGEVCCDNNKIADDTTTTQAPANCVDKVNPKTGVSDCPKMAYLCNNSLYYTLMTEQCPKTCNRCTGGTTTAPTCRDLVDYKTGVSNCPQMAAYCKNSLYLQLMKEQCPKTCGYCK